MNTEKPYLKKFPDANGYFGEFGGAHLPPNLVPIFEEISESYIKISKNHHFISELRRARKHYQGRPTPLYHAQNLSNYCGGAQIYLKREDLNHSGAHKLNHCMGEALLAKFMGKKKLIAETGAGQHGVALATAAAYFNMPCEIHMGEVDMEKEKPNVIRMKLLGANVVPVGFGQKTLKEAVDSAFEAFSKDPHNIFFAIGSVVGPHPFPLMVRDFQHIVGLETREQFLDMTNDLPDSVVACIGGGSNAMGIFSGFLEDPVELYGVEPGGISDKLGEHAATLTRGGQGVLHGFKSRLLTDDKGEAADVYSVASGLDYPGVGPEHAYLNSIKRTNAVVIEDKKALNAFYRLSRLEGIIPALESAHAVAYAMLLAKKEPLSSIIVNLSGRGDKDIDFVTQKYGFFDE